MDTSDAAPHQPSPGGRGAGRRRWWARAAARAGVASVLGALCLVAVVAAPAGAAPAGAAPAGAAPASPTTAVPGTSVTGQGSTSVDVNADGRTAGRSLCGPAPIGYERCAAVWGGPSTLGGGPGGGYSPKNLAAAYDLPVATAGTGQTIAIVDAFNDPRRRIGPRRLPAPLRPPTLHDGGRVLREGGPDRRHVVPTPQSGLGR